MCSNDTLVDTPFQLIIVASNSFMLIKVFSVVLSKASFRGASEGGEATGLLNKGGGSNRLPGLVTKQQAVEFPQVLASVYNNYNGVLILDWPRLELLSKFGFLYVAAYSSSYS